MRVIIQRVKKAKVEVERKDYSSIDRGLLVLCAFETGDTVERIIWMANKIRKLRVFNDDKAKLNLSVQDIKGEILIVSNFTLYGDCLRGTRPDFSRALSYQKANEMYDIFVQEMKGMIPTKSGVFGGDMMLSVEADGPITVVIDK